MSNSKVNTNNGNIANQSSNRNNQSSNIKSAVPANQTKKKSSSSRNKSNQGSSNNNNKKPQVHQVINLQQGDQNNNLNIQSKNEEQFIAELAKKCGAFFNWINQVDYNVLGEQLWKNKMMKIVGERYPELNTEQQQKLIDRDWRIMSPQRKQEILKTMNQEISYEKMSKMVQQDFEKERNEIYLEFISKNNNQEMKDQQQIQRKQNIPINQ